MEKNFNEWNALKQKLDIKINNLNFKERDIWWCSIGININLFFGIPLTTKIKENKFYHKIKFKNNEQCAMLSQLKIFESKRMRSRMGDLPHGQFNEIRKKLAEIILGD